MRPDTQEWVSKASVAQLQCKDLRHSWPRAERRPGVRKLPATKSISWAPLPSGELQRTMHCTGGCGTRRIETFVRRGERLVRVGVPRYKWADTFRRRRPDPDTPLEALDTDVLRGQILTRLYPALRW
jgi:hypothetical protein